MHVPVARERVQIAEQPGVFLVVAVDYQTQTADLIPLVDAVEAMEAVPFSAITLYQDGATQSAARECQTGSFDPLDNAA